MAIDPYSAGQIEALIKRFNDEIKAIGKDAQKGLILGGLKMKGDSMKMTPVDTGNLRGSHYMVSGVGTDSDAGMEEGFDVSDDSGRRVAAEHSGHVSQAKANAARLVPFIEVGCTAFYAEKVHEDLEAKHTTGNAKFLELAFRDNAPKILELVKRFAKR